MFQKNKNSFNLNFTGFISTGQMILIGLLGFVLLHTILRPSEAQTNKEKKDPEQQRDRQKRQDVPLEKYKEYYSQERITYTAKETIKDNCNDKCALVELIFLTRDEDEGVKPYPVPMMDMVLHPDEKYDCEVGGHHFGYSIGDDSKEFRWLVPVVSNCDNSSGVIPGKTYLIDHLGLNQKKNLLNYPIQIPSREELVFKKEFKELNGNKEDPVVRIPVFVEDVLKTKEEPNKQPKRVSFRLKLKNNVSFEKFKEENARIKREYFYKPETWDRKDYSHLKEYVTPSISFSLSDNGKYWETNIKFFKGEMKQIPERERWDRQVFGGTVGVYKIKKTEETYYKKLLMYKKDVQKKTISLTDEKTVDLRNKKWIKRNVGLQKMTEDKDLQALLIKNLKPMSPKRIEQIQVILRRKGVESKGGLEVLRTKLKKEKGNVIVPLSAPKGTYRLVVGGDLINKNFHWPPKKQE